MRKQTGDFFPFALNEAGISNPAMFYIYKKIRVEEFWERNRG